MTGVRVALAAGLAITLAAIGLVLARPPVAVLASNAVPPGLPLTYASTGDCQTGEHVPAGTRAIRLSLYAFTGPRVKVVTIAGGRVLTSGELRPGWSGASITVPVRPVSRAASDVTICIGLSTIGERAVAYGSRTGEVEAASTRAQAAHTSEGEALPGRISVQYMGNGHLSWLSMVSSVADHMALGRAWSGTWVVFLVAALMLAVAALASRLILAEGK